MKFKFKEAATFLPNSRGIDYAAIDPAYDKRTNKIFKRTELVKEGDVEYVIGEYTGELELTPYIEPPSYIELEVEADEDQYQAGELVTFSGEFEDKTLNVELVPLSLLNRDGEHVDNIGISVVDGIVSGTATFDKTGDYYITNKGINRHKNVIPIEIRLKKELIFRVYR